MTSELAGQGGKTFRRVDCWLYVTEGEVLRLCWPNVFGSYPDVISDQTHGVIMLTRDLGPVPETKRPSGKMPIDVPAVGRLTWEDDFDWWRTQLEITPGFTAEVRVTPAEGQHDTAAIAALADFVGWLRLHEQAAREFAAVELLDTYNECWNEDAPIVPETFAGLLRLESVGIDPGRGAELYYEDGDLFAGHCIIVLMDEDRQFRDADIAG